MAKCGGGQQTNKMYAVTITKSSSKCCSCKRIVDGASCEALDHSSVQCSDAHAIGETSDFYSWPRMSGGRRVVVHSDI